MLNDKNYHKYKDTKYSGVITIYRITNPKGLFYIGATYNIEKRLDTYKGNPETFKNQKALHKSITKYGYDAHKVDILYETKTEDIDFFITPHKLKSIEEYYIRKHYLENPTKTLNIKIAGYSNKEDDINREEI